MKTNKALKSILILIIITFIFPLSIKALEASNNTMWTDSDELDYYNETYYTKNFRGPRETKYIGGYIVDSKTRTFCIQPGQKFIANATYNNYRTISASDAKKQVSSYSTMATGTWTLPESSLIKVYPCFYTKSQAENNHNNDTRMFYASVVATQAIMWELITGERTSLSVLKPNNLISGSLYSIITDGNHDKIKNQYYNVLRCANRYGFIPTGATNSKSTSKGQHTLTYDASGYPNQYSYVFTPNRPALTSNNLLKYYKIYLGDSYTASNNCKSSKGQTKNGITCKCNNNSCVFTASESGISDVRVTFDYAYKEDGVSPLVENEIKYFTASDEANSSNYQLLMQGSDKTSFYLHLNTPAATLFHIKATKMDSNGNRLEGVKFDLYDKKNKKITTLTTNSRGMIEYNKIPTPGEYYLKEVSDSTATKNTMVYKDKIYINVNGQNIVPSRAAVPRDQKDTQTNSYVKNGIIYDEGLTLKMTKTTYKVDENGNIVEDTDIQDYCKVQVCENGEKNGPMFEITQGNNKVCVKLSNTQEDGHYNFSRLASKCDGTGETSEIRTCEGKFSIDNMPAGTYTVTEKQAQCNVTLDSELSKTVIIDHSNQTKTVTFENGLTGVTFHKITEDGNLLAGGTYSLQRKINGVYKDISIKETQTHGLFVYDETGTATPFETNNGMANVTGLPSGEYRFVEKTAPEGYAFIKDKDSTAIFTINDKSKKEYQIVELINRKEKAEGSSDSAELIVTIITGRKVVNYTLIIGGLTILLAGLIFLRKKIKK